jgi:HK97 gp10 family phage protein
MDSVTFRMEGLEQMIAALGNISKKIEVEVAEEVNASALKIQSDAKKLAPVNLGTLRNSIQLVSILSNKRLTYTIGTSVSYAPYIEFGTGGKVSIPAGFADFASQFKGKSQGKFRDMVNALTEWVIKKGLAGSGNKSRSVAYAIALSILRKGIRPQPFLIPAFEAEKPILKNKIKDIIKNAKS